MSDWLSFLPFLAVVFVVALSGAVFAPGEWYRSLGKPSWTPPDWLFGPAWTVLYLLIALAGWLIWKSAGLGLALSAWVLNLLFNGAWSWLMFGRRQIAAAFVDALAMLVTIVAFMILAWPSSKAATWLFAPYLGWVAFAAALNASLWARNSSAAQN